MPVTESRKARRLVTGVAALALASSVAVATAAPAAAAPPVTGPPVDNLDIVVPAGLACADFDLHVVGTGSKQIMKTFTDQDGNPVKVITAGKGFDLTFTNMSPGGESIAFPSNGSVSKTTINADGSATVQATGHNVVIFFPTDVPAGPSTTLYKGRLVYTVDPYPNGVFTLQSSSGPTTDICALLA
jgi:hypothetical protein